MALEDAGNEVDRALSGEKRGLAYENAFGGVLSFMRRAYTKDLTGVDLAVTGVPFDQAVTNRPGARFGPRAIREASTLQPCDPPYGWDVDPLSDFAVVDYGDMAFDYGRPTEVPSRIEAHVGGILEAGAGALVLGSVTFSAVSSWALGGQLVRRVINTQTRARILGAVLSAALIWTALDLIGLLDHAP